MYNGSNSFEPIISNVLEDQSFALAEFTNKYLYLLKHIQDDDPTVVFDYFEDFYSSLVPVFNGSDSAYQVSLVKNLSTALVTSAFTVDKSLQLKGKAQKANVAARLLSKIFNIMLADRSGMESNKPSKRLGIYHITNLAFKVYFKLNTVRMCQTFIANLRTGGVQLEQYPLSQQITYRYYIGRYSLFQNRLRLAEKHLQFAFEKCISTQWHNKRLILKYLIPTRILLGKFPLPQLLMKYHLQEPFEPLIVALKTGDHEGFMQHLEDYFDFFYNTFTYVLLKSRGPVLLWRCLLKKTHKYICEMENQQVKSLSLERCQVALQFSLIKELDLMDVESILVSLISQRYIKGYLHHNLKVLVLSKVAPFPKLSDVHVYTERYNDDAVKEYLATIEESTGTGMME
ncbi:unnamed protein product [Cunninghamella echinulata]